MLEDFDAPRELSFLIRIDRCSASQSNDLDGLASSCSNHSPLACSSARPPEAEILLVKQARHVVRVDT